MTFLKKLGQILAAGLQIVGQFFPILQPFLGSSAAAQKVTTGVNDFTQIGQVVLQIETAMQGATGTAKLAAVVPLISQIVKTSELVANHPVANQSEFIGSIQDLANAMVRLLNSLGSSHINTTGNQNAPVPPVTPPSTPVAPVAPPA